MAKAAARGGSVNRSRVMIRNAAFLLGSNLAGWAAGLLFVLVVARVIGPTHWGEFNLGFAIGGLACTFGGFGISTYLLKQIARDRERSSAYLGAGLATYILLSVPVVFAVYLLTILLGYSVHTQQVVLLATAICLCVFVMAPAVSALQALEKMHLNSMITGIRSVVANGTAAAVAVIFRPDIITLILVVLAFNVVACFVQIAVTNRHVLSSSGLTLPSAGV
jgi:O-antigen/teichoic acid export membrane protein